LLDVCSQICCTFAGSCKRGINEQGKYRTQVFQVFLTIKTPCSEDTLQRIQFLLQYQPSKSFKVNAFHVFWKPICDFLLVINSNLGPISHRLAAIAHNSLRSSKVNNFHLIWHSICHFMLVINSNLRQLMPIARTLLKYGRLKMLAYYMNTGMETRSLFVHSIVDNVLLQTFFPVTSHFLISLTVQTHCGKTVKLCNRLAAESQRSRHICLLKVFVDFNAYIACFDFSR